VFWPNNCRVHFSKLIRTACRIANFGENQGRQKRMKHASGWLAALLIGLTACSQIPATVPTQPTVTFGHTLVTLTFDDGDADNYSIRKVLAENDLHATFYIVSDFIGTPGYMTEQQLRGLHEDGNEIGGHTLSHAELTELSGRELRREICKDRVELLKLGFEAVSFAYPAGHYDEESRQTVIDCGYNSARTVTDGPETIPPADAYLLQAMPYVVSNVRLPKLQRYVTQVADAGGGWVIFIFHHICDACDPFSIDLETFTAFAEWLGAQQANGLVVKTVGEVIGGDVRPAVEP